MSASLADATATENAAIASFKSLMATKKNDVGNTQAALAADQKFLAELEKGCATKAAEWEERSKTRGEELVALAETIKVLNDDDALELFKKSLPSASASFLQVQQGTSA